jgi:antitoxin (DNA-binding transcriptional repressor) of toxin-antitoxin stability system
MQNLGITEFRRRCLSLLEDLRDEGLTITKRGRALARITPVRTTGKSQRVKLPLLKGRGRRKVMAEYISSGLRCMPFLEDRPIEPRLRTIQ